jgi:hypothetical protein
MPAWRADSDLGAVDLWVHRWRLTKTSGDMIVIRYADDTIVGFQHEHEARAFLDDLKERMRKFELALHPDNSSFAQLELMSMTRSRHTHRLHGEDKLRGP